MTDSHLVVDFEIAAAILTEHQHTSIKGCRCGWGADDGHLGQSFVTDHLLPLLADAGTTTILVGDQVVPPTVNMLGEIAEQLSRVAGALASPPPTITEEQVNEAWGEHVRMFEERAFPFLEAIGVDVEREPKRQIV